MNKLMSILLISILILTISKDPSLNFIVYSESYNYSDDEILKAQFYLAGGNNVTAVLKDLYSAAYNDTYVSMHVSGGVPRFLRYKDRENSLDIIFNLRLYDREMLDLYNGVSMIEYAGFYVKTIYNTLQGAIEITVTPLYSTRSFYISLCVKRSDMSNIITELSLISDERYDLDTSDDLVKYSFKNIKMYIYAPYSKPQILYTKDHNVSTILIKITGSCGSILIGFNERLKEIFNSLAFYIDYTYKFFKKISEKQPYIKTENILIKNLYLLSLYNSINLFYGDLFDKELFIKDDISFSSYIYLTALSNMTYELEKFLLYLFSSNIMYDPEHFYMFTEALYYMIKQMPVIRSASSLNISKILERIIITLNDLIYKTGNKTIKIAALIKTIDLLEDIALSVGDEKINSVVRVYKEFLLNELKSLFTGLNYQTSSNESFLTPSNILEAISISFYSPPKSDDHIRYVVNYLRSIDLDKIDMNKHYMSLAIETLARYSYFSEALRLSSLYYKKIVSGDLLSTDFYRIVLKGFLGIKIVSEGLIIEPRLPNDLSNASLILYINDNMLKIRFIGWGEKIDAIYLDEKYYSQPLIRYNDLTKTKIVTVILKENPMRITCFILSSEGEPLKDAYVVIKSSYGTSYIGYTDYNGVICAPLPYDVKWIYININDTLGISINMINTGSDEGSIHIDISQHNLNLSNEMSKVYADIRILKDRLDFLDNSIGSISNNLSRFLSYINDVERKISLIDEKSKNLNIILYLIIVLTSISLSISIYSLMGRKR
jgi:hypothetical protein